MNLEALKEKPARFIIGLMSGTSCDGVDAALVRIKGTGDNLQLKFLKFLTIPYPDAFRNRLMSKHISVQEVCLLDFELGEKLAEATLEMKKQAEADGIEIDLVASHGHTIAHVPPREGAGYGTLQIGEAAVLSERTGLLVVSDFRPSDMAAGGQGAPLVPYADWVLFGKYGRSVACLNLGGIANFTVVSEDLSKVYAFDTGPANMAIDGAVRLLTRGEKSFDKDGESAAKGTVIDEFLEYLLSHPYFERQPPKSTGREEFGPEVYLRDALGSRKSYGYDDLMATVTSAVCFSIVRAFNWYIKPRVDVDRIIVSGGGAYNETLIHWIQRALPDVKVRTSDRYGIPSNAREAVAFAILGNETVCGTPANVPNATGASHPVVLGKITPSR
ncbi:MAG: anhydro-N-acetylmuramic acid kinase [Candidatus Hydrogenedentes bacterium]|nr:anhydro-N-acetylmuramic acid kinase [Candidatus Hydrogenedentota bacterium]